MAKVKITQIRSQIGASKKQKGTLVALGLKKINATVEKEVSPQVQGMIDKVNHLVNVEQFT